AHRFLPAADGESRCAYSLQLQRPGWRPLSPRELREPTPSLHIPPVSPIYPAMPSKRIPTGHGRRSPFSLPGVPLLLAFISRILTRRASSRASATGNRPQRQRFRCETAGHPWPGAVPLLVILGLRPAERTDGLILSADSERPTP